MRTIPLSALLNICLNRIFKSPPVTEVRVGEGEGDGEVRGEGKGPTPIVSGIVGSLDFYTQACKHIGIQISSTLGLFFKYS